jgi:hypothetical protein
LSRERGGTAKIVRELAFVLVSWPTVLFAYSTIAVVFMAALIGMAIVG